MKEEILKKIIKHYGNKKQVGQAMEEMAELIVELNKNINRGKDNINDIILEIADVQIMLAQLTIIYNIDPDKLLGAVEYKLLRTEERINNENKTS